VAKDPGLRAIDLYGRAFASDLPVFVAYSGGLDSTVLLHALQTRFPGRLTALHANHGLHGDAGRWATECADFCNGLGVPFNSNQLSLEDAGDGVEASARAARYRWFEACLRRGGVLCMAHHQDDQAETLLLRLLRGAGPEGLSGMPVTRNLGNGSLLRPFLGLPRKMLESYALSRDLAWIEDPSNADRRFDRNYLRHEVMPRLAKRWPGYRATLSRAAAQLREQNEHLPAPTLTTVQNGMGDKGFAVSELPAAPALAALTLRRWLRQHAFLAPPAARLHEFLRQLREGTGAQLCGSGWVIERYRDAVYLHPPEAPWAPLQLPVREGQSLSWGSVGEVTVQVADGKPLPSLMLRTRREGDRLLGPGGKHKNLKTVFQELGIPRWWRQKLPLLVQPSTEGDELLAIAHLRRSPAGVSLGVSLDWKREEFTPK